jgi:sugar-phosphatase
MGSGVLFDLDGVLVDSRLAIERAWRAWAAERGASWPLVARLLPGRRAADTIGAALPTLMAAAVAVEVDNVIDRQVVDTEALRAVDGMIDFVGGLGDARWGTVTSCPHRLAEARLRATGYPWPVPALVADEDVEVGKPHPEPYLVGARRLEVAPEQCLVVEDSPPGVASAKAAGMTVLALRTTHDARELADADAIVADGDSVRVSRS